MKVKFLREYGKNKIGTVKIITADEQEKAYLLSTGTVEILEDDDVSEDIPKIDTDTEENDDQGETQDGEKAGDKRKRSKK